MTMTFINSTSFLHSFIKRFNLKIDIMIILFIYTFWGVGIFHAILSILKLKIFKKDDKVNQEIILTEIFKRQTTI